MAIVFPAGAMFAEQCPAILEEYGYEYGKDYVNLGHYAGGEATLAAFAITPRPSSRRTGAGNDTSPLPIMQEVKSTKDLHDGDDA